MTERPFIVISRAIEQKTGTAVTSSGDALCPAHEDERMSLSVKEARDGKVLLNCHAGCSTESVVAALGLEMGDLFPKVKSNGLGEIVATYDYTDEGGALLYQAVRFRPKNFRQRKPDGAGGWSWSLNGTRRVLFRLPAVLEASKAGRVVCIVEGEKDVDALERLGFTATTNPMGADKWRDEYSAYLKGAHVVIIPDNDEPGRSHAERIARSVHGKAQSVRIVELPGVPEKGDVSDWLAAGGTKEELQRLAKETDEYEPESPIGNSANVQSEELEPGDFWYYEEEAAKIDQSAVIDWLEGQGVCKMFEYDSDVPTKVRRRGLVLEHFPDARIRDLADTHLRQQSDNRPLEAMRRGRNVFLSSTKLDAVKTIAPIFQRSTRDAVYFYYRNGFVTVTAEDILLQPYGDLKGFIYRDWITGREIDLEAGSEIWLDCEFGRFMKFVTNEDEGRLRSLVSAAGYLLSGYKDPADARAIIITEEKISDDPDGGTGKGLFAQALGEVVTATHIDARRLNLDSQFALQAVQPGVTRIIHFDDAGPRFYFDRLFPAITGSLTVEKKGQQQVIVPFEDSPKFIITTNEVLRGRGGSHERRVFEIEFASYFNKDHTPEDEFGHLLFHDWDAAEWNAFDRLMLYCVQYYLQNGLVPYQHVNLAWKKFVRNTSKEFGDFVETFGFEANAPGTIDQTRYNKHELIERFSRDHRQEVTPHKFSAWCRTYAELKGWDFLNQQGKQKDEIAFVERG